MKTRQMGEMKNNCRSYLDPGAPSPKLSFTWKTCSTGTVESISILQPFGHIAFRKPRYCATKIAPTAIGNREPEFSRCVMSGLRAFARRTRSNLA